MFIEVLPDASHKISSRTARLSGRENLSYVCRMIHMSAFFRQFRGRYNSNPTLDN